jgi:hypothetical protein
LFYRQNINIFECFIVKISEKPNLIKWLKLTSPVIKHINII